MSIGPRLANFGDCPRLYSKCQCGRRTHRSESFNPLALELENRSHPELVYLQSRWASAVSFERASALLADVLPIDAVPSSSSIKAQVRRLGEQIGKDAEERGEEFLNSKPYQFPDPPLDEPRYAMELDAGYIRRSQ